MTSTTSKLISRLLPLLALLSQQVFVGCKAGARVPPVPEEITQPPASKQIAQPILPKEITHVKDNSVMVAVPAGPFLRGSPKGFGEDNERPQKQVTLDAFFIDKFAVRAAQYNQCVRETACTQTGRLHRFCFCRVRRKDDYPANCVDWNQAKAYCEWAGKRLPTEAEWEKAARGADGAEYPWGNERPTCKMARFKECRREVGPVTAFADVPSPYGAVQMAGNIWEWVSDWYVNNYYESSSDVNPTGPQVAEMKVLKGGDAYQSVWRDIRPAVRNSAVPDDLDMTIGFRCALGADTWRKQKTKPKGE